jgi:hypothetical protein
MQNISSQPKKKAAHLERRTNVQPILSQQPVNNIPDGYMTSAKFWEKVETGVDEICRKYGILCLL